MSVLLSHKEEKHEYKEPFKLLIDACLPRRYVNELRAMGFDVTYISNIDSHMPDSEVKRIGKEMGAYIATHNVRHFEDYKGLIPVSANCGVRKMIKETVNCIEKYLNGE